MKKQLLFILPLVFLTSCSLANNNTNNPNHVDFDPATEFIPSDFDNNYGETTTITYATNLEQNLNATVRVRAAYKTSGSVTYTLASGFIYNKDDTSYNVVTSASQIAYKADNGERIDLYYEGLFEVTTEDYRKYSATYVASYPEFDIAVLNIKTNDFLPLAILGNSDALRIGQEVSAIGTPNVGPNLINTYSKGVVSGLNRQGMSSYKSYTLYSFPTFQFDAPTNFGMEGGVVLNSLDEVVGITGTKQHGEEGFESLSFAVAINDAKPIIDSLISTHTFERVKLGFSAFSIDFIHKVPWANKFGVYNGIYVDSIIASSKAEEAGLKPETIITGMNVNEGSKININNMEEFQSQLIRLGKGDTIRLHTINSSGIVTTHLITL